MSQRGPKEGMLICLFRGPHLALRAPRCNATLYLIPYGWGSHRIHEVDDGETGAAGTLEAECDLQGLPIVDAPRERNKNSTGKPFVDLGEPRVANRLPVHVHRRGDARLSYDVANFLWDTVHVDAIVPGNEDQVAVLVVDDSVHFFAIPGDRRRGNEGVGRHLEEVSNEAGNLQHMDSYRYRQRSEPGAGYRCTECTSQRVRKN
jgi:hypothetical protein